MLPERKRKAIINTQSDEARFSVQFIHGTGH